MQYLRFLWLTIIFTPLCLVGQIPKYYSNIDFSSNANQIKLDLSKLIQQTHHTNLRYTPDVWNVVLEADRDSKNPNKINLFYGYDNTDGINKTDRSRDIDLRCNFSGDCRGYWNREHVYPRSLGTPNLGKEFAGADAYGIRPTDFEMNVWRSNRAFGDGQGNARVTSSGDFFPGDEWKGDVARIIMYMYLRYPTQCNPNNIVHVKESNMHEMPMLFLKWNVEDPPSELELTRNDIIEKKYQGNRNPFVDNPFLATIIWGGAEAKNFWGDFYDLNETEENNSYKPEINSDSYDQNLAPHSVETKIKTISESQKIRNRDKRNRYDNKRRSRGYGIILIPLLLISLFLGGYFILKK
ncbi:endonuclease [Weeksellaceae bacterium KMM 9713]|uniref:Endonuclease n=1 Tax=Profundicola chukchiensis TaxID=2961959 RepID=A0A9X4MVQ8_9FLAO|nr:endonuclease [Profundicola chukchiensis]MDG4945771.1 endonuclease [Profundicola chukchiensis]